MPNPAFSAGAKFIRYVLLTAYICLFPIAGHSADGQWKDRTQVIWDKETESLIRKNFRVWDPHPELDLEFLWEQKSGASARPAGPAGSSDIVSGSGTLTWHATDAAEYDRRSIYSVYRGEMMNGRPHGTGSLIVRAGQSYTGSWKDGLMNGRGVLRLPDGDKYDGDFVAGQMQGRGTYASAEGWTYVGEFRDGLRDGTGDLILADATYRTVWRSGKEISRELSGPAAPNEPTARSKAPLRLAANTGVIKFKLILDGKRSEGFQDDDLDSASHLYEAEQLPGLVKIGLASKKVIDAWKNNADIASGNTDDLDYIENFSQFSPIFLTAEIENSGAGALNVTAAFLDVQESRADLQPYLEVHGNGVDPECGFLGKYNPVLDFKNFGWGKVADARVVYSLGTRDNRTDTSTVALGSFDASKKLAIEETLRKSGVDVSKLKNGSFKCSSDNFDDLESRVPICFDRLKSSGVLGNFARFAFMENDRHERTVLTNVSGNIKYRWTDSDGKNSETASTFSIDVPLLRFDLLRSDRSGGAGVGGGAECGGAQPILRSMKLTNFSIERRNYRVAVPVNWDGKLNAGETKRLSLNLAAAKSSHHLFNLVLQLANGSTAASQPIDLSYFNPRIPKR